MFKIMQEFNRMTSDIDLNISASLVTAEAGDAVTLTANVSGLIEGDTLNYIWSSGETTQSITVTAPSLLTSNTIYRTCIANNGYVDSNTATIEVKVNAVSEDDIAIIPGGGADTSAGSRKSILMMSSTDTNMDAMSEPIQGSSYFGYTLGIHTIQFTYFGFIGGFGLQGTLAVDPGPDDWFWIDLPGIENFDDVPFLVFPKDPLNPSGDKSIELGQAGDTGTESVTIKGNFTYLRARMTRHHVDPGMTNTAGAQWDLGSIDSVYLCL